MQRLLSVAHYAMQRLLPVASYAMQIINLLSDPQQRSNKGTSQDDAVAARVLMLRKAYSTWKSTNPEKSSMVSLVDANHKHYITEGRVNCSGHQVSLVSVSECHACSDGATFSNLKSGRHQWQLQGSAECSSVFRVLHSTAAAVAAAAAVY